MNNSNPCLEYIDVYGRKTDLIHVSKGATYPINILGNAGTADIANSPVTDLMPDSPDTVAFRVGDELDSHSNEFSHKISKVDEAVKAECDSNGNKISETYTPKNEVTANFAPESIFSVTESLIDIDFSQAPDNANIGYFQHTPEQPNGQWTLRNSSNCPIAVLRFGSLMPDFKLIAPDGETEFSLDNNSFSLLVWKLQGGQNDN